MSPGIALAAGLFTRLNKQMREFIPRQIDDTEAINLLGRRLPAYAEITLPVLLVTGARSPAGLRARSDALAAVLPHVSSVVMPTQGHGANGSSPAELASLLATFADEMFALPAGGFPVE
jgi:pimeloyl-ACP methyl ester carboxylesterase